MSIRESKWRRRSVVPRWRSLLNTPRVELVPASRFPDVPPLTSAHFNDLLKIWKKNGKPEDFADIMDAGLASGSRFLAVQGAKGLLNSGAQLRDRVKERAEVILTGRSTFRPKQSSFDENARDEIIAKIGRLKHSINASPRNSLTYIELARLYCRLAQFSKAEHYIGMALIINPDDRFVLRAATRFFTMIDESSEALAVLRRSSSIKYDPWIQSAELAAAEIAGKSTREAEKAAKRTLGLKEIGADRSELATGWISKLSESGLATKQTLRLLNRALWKPTENALAQSVWLVDSLEGDFQARFPKIRPPIDAHEAKAILLTESGEYVAAREESARWFADQPFQARASIHLSYLNFVHLYDYEGALIAAESGLAIHSSDWMLLNFAALSSIYAGNLDRANLHLESFEKAADGDEQHAYLSAAKGMYAFESKKWKEGYEFYKNAIRYCKKAKRSSLALNAVIYFVESASRNGFVSPRDFDEISKVIGKSVRSLPQSNRREYEQIWLSRSAVIKASLDSFDFAIIDSTALTPNLVQQTLRDAE